MCVFRFDLVLGREVKGNRSDHLHAPPSQQQERVCAHYIIMGMQDCVARLFEQRPAKL